MPHRFDPERAPVLESAERYRFQNPQELVRYLVLAGDETVVDFGTGTGFFAVPLAQALPSGQVYAVDLSAKLLARLTTRAESARVTNLTTLLSKQPDAVPIGNSIADLFLVANVLHELDSPKMLIKEIHRVLRRGRRAVVVDWKPVPTAGHGPPLPDRLPAELVRELFESSGFRLLDTPDLYDYHYVLVFKSIA